MKKLMMCAALAALLAGCSKNDDAWGGSVIPVSLKGIQSVNIDNAGEFPKVSVSSGASVKKEAYMLGIQWIVSNVPSGGDEDKFITAPIQKGEKTYGSLSDRYSKAIKCNTSFNSEIPAGEYVSKFFKEIDPNYLPKGVDEGFVLLVAPDPGEHSFRVEYYEGAQLRFFHDTPTINFY